MTQPNPLTMKPGPEFNAMATQYQPPDYARSALAAKEQADA